MMTTLLLIAVACLSAWIATALARRRHARFARAYTEACRACTTAYSIEASILRGWAARRT